MRAVIHPGKARGVIEAPPSKSMAHRLLIGAGLARGESVVRGLDRSEDVLATVDCLCALGAKIRWEGNAARVMGCDPRRAESQPLDCGECGSTLRFMIPLCLLSGRPARLRGSETLMRRPLSVYEDICRRQGLRFEWEGNELLVKGPLAPGEYEVPGGVSSQFVSGLLFALPLLSEDSTVRLVPPVESRPYMDMTVQTLEAFSVRVERKDGNTLRVPGRSVFRAVDAAVEGDYSNAAFFAALNCVGGDVRLTGLSANSLQGDRAYLDYFPRLERGEAVLDVSDCPDLAPVLFAVAAACHGARFTGTRRLRFKESDRGAAMAEELARFGIKMEVFENEAIVRPGGLHAPREALSSHNDHRVAMALSVLCTLTGGTIEGAQAVRKSLPDYWDRLRTLGVEVELHEYAL
ncbi:MAG: 3-phosphoshikimate 1-carboxyvinyltransferase [Clostridia bacterium]|nr:3-phosphoshikimate 1-carboxyvinyltransferase [Clostridia bacterium]